MTKSKSKKATIAARKVNIAKARIKKVAKAKLESSLDERILANEEERIYLKAKLSILKYENANISFKEFCDNMRDAVDAVW